MEAAESSSLQVTDEYQWDHRLTQAVLTGNRGAVARLISRGNSVNRPFRAPDGRLGSLLYLASALGHRDVVALLLDHDAVVDGTAYDGGTSLHVASQANR